MQIIVHDNKLRKVALINNNYPDMLSFHSDSWHRYLLQATSTFDFTIPKLYNGRLHEDLGFISDKAYFSFKFQGKHHLFYIANITEDDFNIALKCNNTNLELVNEQSIPFTSNSAQNIAWYLQHMELLTFATLEIGVNEIADKTRTLTFESQETKLSRLQSLMSRFNAEFEFVTELNNNGTLKRIVLNIYHEADNEHHGIGKVRSDVVLRYGNDVKGVQVTTDKTQLFNTGVFTGADGLTLKDVERSDKDSKGNEEFYTRKGSVSVYAPLSMERYPASMKDGDNWTRKDFQTEYTNVNDLLAYAFRTIKQYAYPIVSYTASIQSSFLNDYQDLVLGDTVKIYDKNFVGGLILQARVTEQVISFSNPNNNTLTFSNHVKLDSKISDTLRNRMAEMIEARLPYTLKMSTSAGTSFKNGTGESIVTPELYKGQKKITDATYRYYFGSEMTTGQTYKVLANKIENKQVLTVAAYIGNNEVARDKLTFINVFDGKNGLKGDKGAIDEEKLKEIEQNINSKADGVLTQEQINALNEKNSIMRAELEAKASLGTLNKAIAEYKSYTLQNNKDKAKSEKDLISLNQRLVENIRNLKELAERWNFLDKYFQVGNEGIIFGEQNGNTCAKMSNNRFSIFSAGTEVMYISQGTLFIENGIFSKSIQIGRFREEQYHLNLDMNVIRYVGGI
ncbi:MAG: phage tail protein [Streptococcus anginosus]|nr:phage tail protein [Streptococcus anginosus]MDU4573986.1 phage tail protein [Streptococcus anginosus]